MLYRNVKRGMLPLHRWILTVSMRRRTTTPLCPGRLIGIPVREAAKAAVWVEDETMDLTKATMEVARLRVVVVVVLWDVPLRGGVRIESDRETL